MMTLPDFRRLCVEYGEARARADHSDYPAESPYIKEWRRECDRLWAKIQEEERQFLHILLNDAKYFREAR